MNLSESFHMRHRLPTGTRVYDVHDRRHVGRLDAYLMDGQAVITFDNGIRARVPEHRVRKAEHDE